MIDFDWIKLIMCNKIIEMFCQNVHCRETTLLFPAEQHLFFPAEQPMQFSPTREITNKTLATICAAGKQHYCSPPNNQFSPTTEITYNTLAKII